MNKDIVIGSTVILVIIALLFWLFSEVSHELLLGLLAGWGPSLVLLYLQKRKEEKEDHDWLLRNKEACLTQMVNIFISSLHDKKSSDEEKSLKLLEKFKQIQPALFAWGSPDVLRAWNEVQKISPNEDPVKSFTRKGERFFRAIRKELGHDDSSLKPGEVWATLLKEEDREIALDACKKEKYEWLCK